MISVPLPISPACGSPTDWGDFVQVHNDQTIFRAATDELPAIDIQSLRLTPDASHRSPSTGGLVAVLRRGEKITIAGGALCFEKPPPYARNA